MPGENAKKHKHLTLDDRVEIQTGLNEGLTFRAIARKLGKDPCTISKEIRKHRIVSGHMASNSKPLGECSKTMKAPFVCNSCKKRRYACGRRKYTYHAKAAQDEYKDMLVTAREGIPLNKESFYEMDRVISEGINQGQHLYHILTSSQLGVSKSTVYRHLQKGYLSISALDLPRVVKFKPRRHGPPVSVPKGLRVGRTYEEFKSFVETNGVLDWVEMDTVIGRIGGNVIMTFDFTFCNFMFGLLLDDKTASQVTDRVRELKSRLLAGGYRFGDVMPLILTDNGGEFSHVSDIENDLNGVKETSLFFCDPYKSCQKPRVEKNHTLFRDIVPKGQSFDSFDQSTVNLIFSHVNGVRRKILGGKTPYEWFCFKFGANVASLLGISYIKDDKVIQSSKSLSIRSSSIA